MSDDIKKLLSNRLLFEMTVLKEKLLFISESDKVYLQQLSSVLDNTLKSFQTISTNLYPL